MVQMYETRPTIGKMLYSYAEVYFEDYNYQKCCPTNSLVNQALREIEHKFTRTVLVRKQVLSNRKFPKSLEIVDEEITGKDSDGHPRSEFRTCTGSKVGKCGPVSIRNIIAI